MSPQKVLWLFMQGFTTKYDLCKAERGDFVVNRQAVTLHTRKTCQVPLRHNSYQAARKRRANTGKRRSLAKGSIAYIKGLQRKENINGPPGCIRILIMRIKKVLRRHVCREKKKRAETGSSGLARKSTSEVSCPFPSEMGYHNPIFENSVFITRSPLVYPDMVCSVSEYKILIE